MSRIKNLITGYHCYQIFRIGKIDNVMCSSRNNIDCFNLISTHFKFHSFSGIDISFLNQPMTMYNNELLPFNCAVTQHITLSKLGLFYSSLYGNLPKITKSEIQLDFTIRIIIIETTTIRKYLMINTNIVAPSAVK